MKPNYPYQYTTGETLGPSLLVANMRRLQQDVNREIDRRYHYSTFTLDWSEQVAGSTAPYQFQTPYAFDIVRMEMMFALSVAGTVDISTPAGTISAESATTGTETLEKPCRVAANSTLTFTPTVSGGGSISALALVVTIRTDRWAVGTTYPKWELDEATLPRSGDASSEAEFNLNMSAGTTAATASKNNKKALRIEVRRVSNIGAVALTTGQGVWRAPAGTRTLAYYQMGLYTLATSIWRVVITNPAAGVSLVGAGATTLALSALTALGQPQADSAHHTAASDSIVTLSRFGGTTSATRMAYVVLFWT